MALKTTFKKFRDAAKWWTVASSVAFAVVSTVNELNYIDWRYTPTDVSPLPMRLAYMILFWTTLLLGLLTIPRWYSFIAFAAIILVILQFMGR